MATSLSSLPKRGRDVCIGIPFSSLSSHRQFAMKSYHFFCLSMVSATCYGELQIQKSQKSLSLLPANMRIDSIFLLSTACLLHPSRKHIYPTAHFLLSSGKKLPFLWVQCCSLILPRAHIDGCQLKLLWRKKPLSTPKPQGTRTLIPTRGINTNSYWRTRELLASLQPRGRECAFSEAEEL